MASFGPAVISLIDTKSGDYYEETYPRSDSRLFDVHRSYSSLFFVQPAQGFTMTLAQVGSNVVASGSGAINLTGLTFLGSLGGTEEVGIQANIGIVRIGFSPGFVTEDLYGGFTGPTSFGSGGVFAANSGSGDLVGNSGFVTSGNPLVPQGYASGDPLTNSMTFNNATFASLGVTTGTYVWSWGTGLPNQNFTLIIGGVGVPDGGTTVSLLGCALLGLAVLRRKLSC